jgi:hypothetical protein
MPLIAVAVTSQPLFTGKSHLFCHCQFLIGADTFKRIVDLKYYKPLHVPAPVSVPVSAPVLDTASESSGQGVAIDANSSPSVSEKTAAAAAAPVVPIQTSVMTFSEEIRNIANFTAAMAEIHANHCSFIVCGRVSDPAKDPVVLAPVASLSPCPPAAFETMDSIICASPMARLLVEQYANMFVGIGEKDFRADISSTILRRRREKEEELRKLQSQAK